MEARSDALQAFLEGIREAAAVGIPPASLVSRAANQIFGALQARTGAENFSTPARLPVCDYLGEALARARSGPHPVGQIVDAFEQIEHLLTWRRRAGSDATNSKFHEGHANAVIVGPTGIEKREDARIGISLMAPAVRYPDHQHPPEEVYIVLSAGEWLQEDGTWVEPGIGGIIYNPPGAVHAMSASTTPLLAVWCLWTGRKQ